MVEVRNKETGTESRKESLLIEVRSGDSLWKLSQRYYGSGAWWGFLAKVNSLLQPQYIVPGQQILVPVEPQKILIAADWTQQRAGKIQQVSEEERFGWTPRANRSWTAGEKLTFAVRYFKVTAGFATLEITDGEKQTDRPCYRIEAVARTHPFFENFFRVRDSIVSFVDQRCLFPWRYEKHLQEGKFRSDRFTLYDQRAGVMQDDRGEKYPMEVESQDVMSCFYYFRSLPELKAGDTHWIKVAADNRKNYRLKVEVQKQETIRVLAGKFDCLKVQPFLEFEGVFQQKGDVHVWLTNDERRLPVLITSKIAIGSIYIELQDALWVKPASSGE